ncbi:purple acid phosphatase family protein [Staphylococcus saprophyticus]|uniref:Purple acid phosphatase n=2 Tax=Staphylococcus TaxID=1279 RepID=A0A380HJC9_STASA|nr:metallophosphoesterase family protein [Staphylococcus saprophyticus]SUM81742.1 purple acid phosphatase [Staphylococcus saprophyticus]
MKKRTSSIIFTLSAVGVFIGTHHASASELEGQQKEALEPTTDETRQSDETMSQSQTSDKQLERDTYPNKEANIVQNNTIHNTDDTTTQSQINNNKNFDKDNSTSDNGKAPQAKAFTSNQQDKSNETLASSQKQQEAPSQLKLEQYTDSKAHPQLPSQSTSHQHNPGNNQQTETDNTDKVIAKEQQKKQQSENTQIEDNHHEAHKELATSDKPENTDIKDTKQPSKSSQPSYPNNDERTKQEQNNKETVSNQTQSNEHRHDIMTIGKDNTEKNLTWYHESEEQGYVEIAKANDRGDFSNARRIEGQTHQGSNTKRLVNKDIPNMNYTQATLPNLEENKAYMYRFYNGENGEKSAIRRFDTNNNGETNFIAVADPQLGASGDLASDNEGWQNTVNQMAQLNQDPDFLMSLGDQVNLPWDEKAYSGFIEAKGMENFTVVPTLGNHDRANKAYSEHFNLPNLQNGGKNFASSDFYFTHNDTLFVSLNSESLDFKGHEETLKRAIADTKDQNPKWIVGLTHRNPYSAGKHSDKLASKIRRDKFAPLMEKYNIDLVLGGHDHSYSRSHVMKGKDAQVQCDENGQAPQTYTNPDGTIYVTLNSASGSKFYELDGEKDYAAKSIQDNQPAYTKVNITKDYIELLTYHVPQGNEKLGEPIDRVRINKDNK